MSRPLCIYHSPCLDGFGAAWVVRKFFGGEVDFHPGVYGQAPPDVRGRDVIMVDFSYKQPVMMNVAKAAASVLLLDHHKSAVEDIGGVPRSIAVPLSNGKTSFVDVDDLPLVAGYSWSEQTNGGAVAYVGGGRSEQELVYMHHLILPPRDGLLVDHHNRDSLDNRRCNLRHATKEQNAANMDRGSRFKGITPRKGRWIAQIAGDYIGTFDTDEEAARAYDEKAKQRWGEYARLNFGQRDPFPPNCEFHFDMCRSGAGMAWDYFFAGQPRPQLIDKIEDRDLWRFAFNDTRAINGTLFSYPYDFDVWDNLAQRLETDDGRSELVTEGLAIDRKMLKDIGEFLGFAQREMVIGGHKVPVVNLPYFMASEAAGQLAESAPFAAAYYDKGDARVFSLRSRKGGVDVAEIAKAYGGGGHAGAAGFQRPVGWEGDK